MPYPLNPRDPLGLSLTPWDHGSESRINSRTFLGQFVLVFTASLMYNLLWDIYQVVSLNTPMADSSKFDMKYLLKRPEPPSTTTTTTTSKPVHPDQFLEVFVLIVNEQDFVTNNNTEKFRAAVWKIFTE